MRRIDLLDAYCSIGLPRLQASEPDLIAGSANSKLLVRLWKEVEEVSPRLHSGLDGKSQRPESANRPRRGPSNPLKPASTVDG